jgi:uncharacterized membrane protein YoaK (UPF0700 family)
MPDQPSNPLADASATEHRAVGSLPSAILLAITGGSLDAFIYLNHGHVFAAAMTGNGVLLGVSILHHDYAQTVRHLLPIFGFILGVFFAHVLDKTLKNHAVTVGLICEISALFIASFLPGRFPDLAFVPIIAIVAAYQVTSFRKADNYAYNSTFMTGNLRPPRAKPACENSANSPSSSSPSSSAPPQAPSSPHISTTTPSGSSISRSSSSSS